MKPRRPIGVLRLIAPLLGRGRRRWRGSPLVPMIWRRRLRAQPAASLKAVRPAPSAPGNVFNLTLVWPAGTAARAEPIRRFETGSQAPVRSGRDAGARETSRLTTLVELLWLRSGNAGAPGAPLRPVPQPTSRRLSRGLKQDELGASPQRGSATAPVESSDVPGLWPHATMLPPGGAALPRAGAGIAGPHPSRVVGRQARAGAMRLWRDSQPGRPVLGEPTRGEAAEDFSTQASGAPVRRDLAARPHSPTAGRRPPSRSRTNLVWRKDEPGDARATPSHPHLRRTSAPDLVWRRPAPAPARDGAEASRQLSPDASGRGDVHVQLDRPAATLAPAPAAPAPAAIQPAEMSRLVDEVVRRLDRIGRDERLRRGI